MEYWWNGTDIGNRVWSIAGKLLAGEIDFTELVERS